MTDYPICLNKLHRTLCVVVGGGAVAERKVRSLLEAQAMVRIVSPQLTEGLQELADQGLVQHITRPYRLGDLEGAFLTIAATDNRATNCAVREEAESRQSLVNVVDAPEFCNFTVPAVLRRGSLVISISTEGQSPALAAHVREQLESVIGPEYVTLTEILGGLRDYVIEACPVKHRRTLWSRLIDSNVLDLLREGQPQVARDRAKQIVDSYVSSVAVSSN